MLPGNTAFMKTALLSPNVGRDAVGRGKPVLLLCLFVLIGLMTGCGGGGGGGGGGSSSGPKTPGETDLSKYTITELGNIESHFSALNDVGDVLAVRGGDNALYRFHNGAWARIATSEARVAGALSPTDSRYVASGVLYTEDSTPIPTPTGLPRLYASGNTGLVVFVESVTGEWAYGYTMQNPGAVEQARPFRWKIAGGAIEPLGEPGDYEYDRTGEQFLSRVTGDRNGRALLRTVPGSVAHGVYLSSMTVYEPDGTRVNLNGLLGGQSSSWRRVTAEITEDGTVIGSGEPGASVSTQGERMFSYAAGTVSPASIGGLLRYQSGLFFFSRGNKTFTWTPQGGEKAAATSPIGEAFLAKQNRRGRWLVSKDGGTAARLLTPK